MKVVLAYSGGLDTSTILVLLREEYGAEVVTVTVDVGQEGELEGVEERAYELGASKHYMIDAKEEFVHDYIFPAVKANALYEGKYPLGTALARPLIASKLAEVALKEGADAVAHGCTGKGNDQVRFDITLRALLGDEVEIIAPVREYSLTRAKSIEILAKHGYSVPSIHKKYSVDENLWSRSIEGGVLDDPEAEPPEEVYQWTKSPLEAPDEPLYLEIGFEEGVPKTLDGVEMGPVEIVKTLNSLVGSHGYGRIDYIESRVVGLKSREVYEAPAALTLVEAHKDLERMVLTPGELRLKWMLDAMWSDLVYQGLWIDPVKKHIDLAIDSMNKYVTGVVKLKIYKGGLMVVGRNSPYTLYSEEKIDYDTGWYPDPKEAEGFIKLFSQHQLTAIKTRKEKETIPTEDPL